jgi:hypothetical protein
MRTKILTIGTMGLAGLVAGGLMALPVTATAVGGKDQVVKRDEDTPDVVLVTDDDDDDGTDTNTSNGTNTGTQTNTRTGTRSGRDNSWTRARKDFTKDGPGGRKVDWSQNHTNDMSRHNTRG